MTLSKREKTLLFVLALLIILLASWTYIITPVLSANRVAKQEYEAAKAEKEQMELLMPSLIGADSRLSQEKIRALADDYFFRDLKDTEIDRMIQQIAAAAGVSLTSVTMQPPQIGSVAEGGSAEEIMDSAVASTEGENVQASSAPTQSLYLCSFTMNGALPNLINTLNSFAVMDKSVSVDTFNIKGNGGNYTAEVNLTFYFAEG